MEASEGNVVYTLRGEALDIIPVVAASGAVERLTYRDDDGEEREFSGAEISSASTAEGIRATVVLEDGAADGPIVRFSILLPVVQSPQEGPFDVCAAAVRTTQRSLLGGMRPGPQQSFAALTLTGTVAVRTDDYGDGAVGECRDWNAVHDQEPPGPFKLVVTGTCAMPTPGYAVELRPRAPQGINPKDLLLDKIVTAPSGIQPRVLTDVDVRYEDETDVDYDTVTILPDGPTVDVVVAV